MEPDRGDAGGCFQLALLGEALDVDGVPFDRCVQGYKGRRLSGDARWLQSASIAGGL